MSSRASRAGNAHQPTPPTGSASTGQHTQCPGHMAATAITACGRGLLARLTLADAAASHAALAAVQRRSHAATVLAARYRAHAASSALAEARWATDTVAHGWRRFKIRDWTQIGKTVRYDGPSRPVEHGPLTGVWIERFTHGTSGSNDDGLACRSDKQ